MVFVMMTHVFLCSGLLCGWTHSVTSQKAQVSMSTDSIHHVSAVPMYFVVVPVISETHM